MLSKKIRQYLAATMLISVSAWMSQAKAFDLLSDVVHGVVDTSGEVVKGTVTVSGDIVDSSGRVIGHAATGTMDASGNIIDASGRTIAHIIVPGQPQQTTTVVTTGTPVYFTDVLETVLDNRRIEIDRMISKALIAGTISAGQAGDFRTSLSRIEAAEIADRASGGGLSYDEAVDVARDLDSLTTSVIAAGRLVALTPLIVVDPSGAVRFSIGPSTYTATSIIPTENAGETTIRRTTTITPGGTNVTSTSVTTDPIPSAHTVTTTTTTTPGTVITTPAGRAVVMNGGSGTIVAIRTVQPDLLVNTLQVRSKDLERLIKEARSRNAIKAAQAELMLDELARVQQEATISGITYGRAVLLARDLDVIGAQIATIVPAVPQPIIAGSHLTIVNGEIANLDDVAVRRSELEGRIAKDLLEGRLSPGKAAELRSEMNAIETMEATFRQHDGDLSLRESRMLYTNFDKVASKLDHWAGKEY